MPRSREQDRATVIAQALSRGMSITQISGVMGISKRTVTRVSSSLKKHGTPKPPPTGAKQGRPAKVTRPQAQALLAWITAREYIFYIKDLVGFLRAHHGYKGCDGTIRRALVRAGFRRQEPHRTSEVTRWIPPSHAVNFTVIAEGDDDEAAADQSPDPQPATSALQQTSAAATAASLEPGQKAENAAPAEAGSGTGETHAGQDLRLDPALRGEPAASAPTVSTPIAAKKRRSAARTDDVLIQRVDALQNEVARKDQLIEQLNQRLAQSEAQNGMALSSPQPA